LDLSTLPKGKIIGIDYGSVRIGISLSDELQMMAFGKEVILNNKDCLLNILNIIKKESVSMIVLGYPLNLKGEKTPQTSEVEKFETALRAYLDSKLENNSIRIIRCDERFTSKMAQESMITSGMKKMKRQDKSNLDIISAALLLQSYLDRRK
jgi:putative holliday junction resolvase